MGARPRPAARYTAIQKSIGFSGNIAPDRLYTVLKFTDWGVFSAAPANRLVFRANSIFDPGFTAGSAQPPGFDQLATIYAYYRVLWCSIKVTMALSTSATNPAQLSVYPSIASNPFTTTVGNNGSQAYGKETIGFVSSNMKSLTNFMSTKKIWGDRSEIDSVYQSSITTNPNAAWYWICDAITLTGGNFANTDAMHVTLQFGCFFEGRGNVAQG